MTARTAKELDQVIGNKIRAARLQKGWNQSELGRAVGVTFQQIQKYENGSNRIAVSTLAPLCEALEIEPASLFPRLMKDGGPAPDPFAELGATIGGYKLALLYAQLDDQARKSLLSIAEAIVGAKAAVQASAEAA